MGPYKEPPVTEQWVKQWGPNTAVLVAHVEENQPESRIMVAGKEDEVTPSNGE